MSKLVFMDHDGGIDDLLSQLLLLTMPDVELIGISVTPADCYIEPAIESTYKILQLLDQKNTPIGRGDYNGINAFPNDWRARPECVNALPMLINLPSPANIYELPSAVDLMIEKISTAKQNVTVLLTGPCSNLVLALEKAPELKNKIEEVVWMAGAFRVAGNVMTFQHDSTAEWNVYWDPINAKKLFKMELPLVLIPLDVTNQVPVKKSFLSKLAQQSNYKLSNLAGQFWAMTLDTIPAYHYTYYMWDILATSYLAIPHEFTTEQIHADLSTRPPNAGQTFISENGFKLKIATAVNEEVFYEYLLQQFKR